MNFEQVESEVKKLSKKINKESYVYDFLSAFGTAKSTITMLKNGSRNLSKKENEVICKKKILFLSVDKKVEESFEEVVKDKNSFKHEPRFIVVTDHKELFALDTKLMDRVDFKIKDIHKKFDFFLPLAGIEKKEFQHENPVDVKAAEKLAKLFDLIKSDNPKSDEKSLHSLNVFLTRLLFCYFAEDTDIFPKGLFSGSVASHTQLDGSDLSSYLKKLFAIMNVEARPSGLPDYIAAFPYVNGGLFAESHSIPRFSKKSRRALLDIAELDWAEINPDIFGSMIQAVVHPEQRAGLGVHYTSVSNIMKVIEPLFLNDLYEELEKSKKSINKLKKLLKRISEIKIFDPACGSGNFLIIAYKELRKLEMKIYTFLPNEMKFSYVPLSNFYGIEIDDFAHEVAILSLWLAEHQMDILFYEEFGAVKASLPLKEGGNIVCENATRVNWIDVCNFDDDHETYIIGNPPYAGQRNHKEFHKKDMDYVFQGLDDYKKTDYISCWFYKAVNYLSENVRFAFVTTSSICQGIQVPMLWPKLITKDSEIHFCYKPFKWKNNAKDNAGVSCTIIGMRKRKSNPKFIFDENNRNEVKNINAYLVSGKDVIVKKQLKPISNLQKMEGGNQPREGGYLMLTDQEKNDLLVQDKRIEKFIRPLMGSNEFIKGIKRWCIWIEDEDLPSAMKVPELKKRINLVQDHRENGNSVERSFAKVPHRFVTVKKSKKTQLIIPTVSSETREYIPIGFLDNKVAVSSRAFVIPDPDLYLFAVLNSLMHITWVKAICGRLESRLTYSSVMCYNTFPFPDITEDKKNILNECVFRIIGAREKYPHLTMGEMYDPNKMPEDLREAHRELDTAIDKCYRPKIFESNNERLELLFKLYSEKIKEK